jgi:hypothetical protein
VQRELAALYEAHLVDLGERFGRALERGGLANDPEAIRAWLAAEELSPDAFIRDRISKELVPGQPLHDRTVARRLAGQPALAGPAALLPDVEQLAALERQLGDLAKVLRPNRLLALRQAAKLTHLPVTNLADRLSTILRRVQAPEESLARLERLLDGRHDAEAVLEALGRSANPRPALEALTPEMLNAATPAGIEDLVDALARGGQRPGEQMARIVSDLHPSGGGRRVFREVVHADGRRTVESWDGASGIWRPEPQVRLRPGPAPAAPAPPPVGEEARAAARARLEEQTAARIRRGRGRLTRQAERLQRARAAIAAHPEGERILAEIVDASARDGAEVATDILQGLASLPDGPLAAELEAVAGYLRTGGDARTLAAIVSRATTQPSLRRYLRDFLARLPTLTERQLRGLQLVVAERGLGQPGGQAALYLVNGFREHTGLVLESLADLAPRSENLRYLIGYLASPADNLRIAGLGHLLAARDLLAEFGEARLVFEAPGIGARRVIDVQVVTAHTGARLLDVEIKEVTILKWATNPRAQSELARDIVRSTKLAEAGEAPLERIRWLVRRDELTLEFGTQAKVLDALKERLLGVFDSELVRNALTAAELQAARQDFINHFDRIVRLF